MGGDGPHSGARNSSFGLATLGPDRFAGLVPFEANGQATSKLVNVTGKTLTVTLDVWPNEGNTAAVLISIVGMETNYTSKPLTVNGTDVEVEFGQAAAGLAPLVGREIQLLLSIESAQVFTFGFK